MNHSDCGQPASSGDLTDRLKILIKANQALARLESLQVLLPTLNRLASEVTVSEGASVMLFDSKSGTLKFEVLDNATLDSDRTAQLKSRVELELGQGIAGWVAQKLQPVIVNDAQADARFFHGADQTSGFVTRNMICIPILYHDELLGVVTSVNSKYRPCFDEADLSLLESFAQLAAVALIRSRLLESQLKSKQMEVEQENAAQIQRMCWPELPEADSGSHVWALCEPAGFVGGDAYDLVTMPDGSWLFYLADVSGKGMPAALLAAALTLCFSREAVTHKPVDELIISINQGMYQVLSKTKQMLTMILGRYWPKSGELHLCRAGHPLPLWIRDGKRLDPPDEGGLPLGVFLPYECQSCSLVLQPGDRILFYSDGMTEAMDQQRRMFEQNALPQFLEQKHEAPMGPDLTAAVRAWQEGTQPSDDLTLLEIWRD